MEKPVRLPVSARVLESTEQDRDRARAALATLQEKYDALLRDHLAYLRPAKTESTARSALAPKERDALMVLAAERGGRDAGLRRHLMAYVQHERAAGTPDETIADKLTAWDDPEDEGE